MIVQQDQILLHCSFSLHSIVRLAYTTQYFLDSSNSRLGLNR